jgi:hypothetical protein
MTTLQQQQLLGVALRAAASFSGQGSHPSEDDAGRTWGAQQQQPAAAVGTNDSKQNIWRQQYSPSPFPPSPVMTTSPISAVCHLQLIVCTSVLLTLSLLLTLIIHSCRHRDYFVWMIWYIIATSALRPLTQSIRSNTITLGTVGSILAHFLQVDFSSQAAPHRLYFVWMTCCTTFPYAVRLAPSRPVYSL